LRLDPSSREVSYDSIPVSLSPKEYGLLELFLRNGNRVFSRAQIIDHLWTLDRFPEETTIKAHTRSLRQKLKSAGAPEDFIETLYGSGYRLKPL
jgi:DNA-binding response OmpR family regulator